MTEFGRRGAILAGATAMLVVVLIAFFTRGNLVSGVIQGLAAALLFGAGGLLIGNLMHGYVISAAQREATRITMQREIAEELAARSEEAEGVGEDIGIEGPA